MDIWFDVWYVQELNRRFDKGRLPMHFHAQPEYTSQIHSTCLTVYSLNPSLFGTLLPTQLTPSQSCLLITQSCMFSSISRSGLFHPHVVATQALRGSQQFGQFPAALSPYAARPTSLGFLPNVIGSPLYGHSLMSVLMIP